MNPSDFRKRAAKGFRATIAVGAVLAVLSRMAGFGQDATRITVALHDPARPGVVKASQNAGAINVKGYEGKEIVILARPRTGPFQALRNGQGGGQNGSHSDFSVPAVTAREENNTVTVTPGLLPGGVDLEIQVPHRTSLKLSCLSGGELVVEDVEGEIEANELNGLVQLRSVSGAVVAHSLNGDVQVSLRRLAPDAPMSFSTLNGNIDVTLPASTQATVKMETQNGSLYSDFEIQLTGNSTRPGLEPGRTEGTHFRASQTVRIGTINGGGPEFQFKTINGTIHLRKAK